MSEISRRPKIKKLNGNVFSSHFEPVAVCDNVSFRLRDDTSYLVKCRARIQAKLEKHTMYHKYLEKVLEGAEEFHEIREIIARYDTLTATHEVMFSPP